MLGQLRLASAVTLLVFSRTLSVGFLGCKVIEVQLSRFWFEISWLSLVSCICIHVSNGSFAEAIEIDSRALESASPEVSFLYVREFL
jgi:hypothetical protein